MRFSGMTNSIAATEEKALKIYERIQGQANPSILAYVARLLNDGLAGLALPILEVGKAQMEDNGTAWPYIGAPEGETLRLDEILQAYWDARCEVAEWRDELWRVEQGPYTEDEWNLIADHLGAAMKVHRICFLAYARFFDLGDSLVPLIEYYTA